MRKQYHFRPSERGLRAWDVDRLVALTKDFPTFDVPLGTIRELDEPFWFSGGDREATCRAVVEHARIIGETDLSFPIILSSDGRVMDGMHRVGKALLEGRTTIAAVQFEHDPQPDFVDVHPDELPYDDGQATSDSPTAVDRSDGGENEAAARVRIRILQADEAAVLDNVAAGVFDGPIQKHLTQEFLIEPRHHLAVATDAGLVVGMASGVHYVHPDKTPELWINEVGVAPTHRGQAIGRRLLQALFARAAALNCTEAWVLTSTANVPAQRMYTASGGVADAEPQVMFTFALRGDD